MLLEDPAPAPLSFDAASAALLNPMGYDQVEPNDQAFVAAVAAQMVCSMGYDEVDRQVAEIDPNLAPAVAYVPEEPVMEVLQDLSHQPPLPPPVGSPPPQAAS